MAALCSLLCLPEPKVDPAECLPIILPCLALSAAHGQGRLISFSKSYLLQQVVNSYQLFVCLCDPLFSDVINTSPGAFNFPTTLLQLPSKTCGPKIRKVTCSELALTF